jgi:hypothetical protein
MLIAAALIAAFAVGLFIRTPGDRVLEACLADPVCAADFVSDPAATITP